MDRSTLLTIASVFIVFSLWSVFALPPQSEAPAPQATATETAAPKEVKAKPVMTQARAVKDPVEKSLRTREGRIRVSDHTPIFSHWELTNYRESLKEDANPVDLRSVTQMPGNLKVTFDRADYENWAYLDKAQGTFSKDAQGRVSWVYEDAKVRWTRTFQADTEHNFVDVDMVMEFKVAPPKEVYLYLSGLSIPDDPEAQDRRLSYYKLGEEEGAGELTEILLSDVRDEDPTDLVFGRVHWAALQNRYFAMALINRDGFGASGQVLPNDRESHLLLKYPVEGQRWERPLRVFFGSKDLHHLAEVEPSLDQMVDFGFASFLAYPLLKLLKWFYGYVDNYGFAIILLTLLVRIATFPLNYKSMKSMKQMSKLQPKIQKIREKWEHDKERLNREMLNLMKQGGYNPAAGCLPILVQLPVFYALYRVLYSAVELYQAPFGLWIVDLSAMDPYYVFPVLVTGTFYLQQKLQPNTSMDPTQQKILQFMPLMFGVFMINLPAGLGLYFFVSSLVGIIQQFVLNKKLDGGPARVAAARAR